MDGQHQIAVGIGRELGEFGFELLELGDALGDSRPWNNPPVWPSYLWTAGGGGGGRVEREVIFVEKAIGERSARQRLEIRADHEKKKPHLTISLQL